MQRPCLLAATKKVEFVDIREFAAAAGVEEGEMLGGYRLLSGKACADAGPPHPPHGPSFEVNLSNQLVILWIDRSPGTKRNGDRVGLPPSR